MIKITSPTSGDTAYISARHILLVCALDRGVGAQVLLDNGAKLEARETPADIAQQVDALTRPLVYLPPQAGPAFKRRLSRPVGR